LIRLVTKRSGRSVGGFVGAAYSRMWPTAEVGFPAVNGRSRCTKATQPDF